MFLNFKSCFHLLYFKRDLTVKWQIFSLSIVFIYTARQWWIHRLFISLFHYWDIHSICISCRKASRFVSYLQAIWISRAEAAVLCVKYIQNTTTLHRGFFWALPGFQRDFSVFRGTFPDRAHAEEQKTSWDSCRRTSLWLTPSQASNCWNFRSSGSALASREDAIWEQTFLQKFSVHFLQHITGWRSGSSIPIPRARIGLAGSQSRPFLPRWDANNLFPLQLSGLAARSVPFPPCSACRGQTYPSKPTRRWLQGRRATLPPRGCGASGGFSTGSRTAAPGGAGAERGRGAPGGALPEEPRGRGAPRSPEGSEVSLRPPGSMHSCRVSRGRQAKCGVTPGTGREGKEAGFSG